MSQRVASVDLARLLALLSIMVVHVLLPSDPLVWLTSGWCAALFALVSGVTLSITDRRPVPKTLTSQLVRVGWVGMIGLTLGLNPGPIAVILVYDSMFFLLAFPLRRFSARILMIVTALIILLGPVLSYSVRTQLPVFDGSTPSWVDLAHPIELLTELTLTGYYPALPWLAYVTAGMVLGRMLDQKLTRVWIVGAAATLVGSLSFIFASSVKSYQNSITPADLLHSRDLELMQHVSAFGVVPPRGLDWLLVSWPYSSTSFDLLRHGGIALLAFLLVRSLPRFFERFSYVGASTLTLYSAHVLITANTLVNADVVDTRSALLVQFFLLFTFAWAYRVLKPYHHLERMPLEVVMNWISARLERVSARVGRSKDSGN